MLTQDIAEREMLAHQMTSWNLFLSRPEAPHTIVLQNLALSDEPYTAAAWRQISGRLVKKLETARDALAVATPTSYREATLARLESEIALFRDPNRTTEQREWYKRHSPQKPETLLRINDFFANRPAPDTPGVAILPATQKLRQDQFPEPAFLLDSMRLDAARGEGENLQLVVYSVDKPLEQVTVEASTLTHEQSGETIVPRLNVVAYIPVKKPTLEPFGFGEKGLYPDPLCPNAPFDLAPFTNQSVWFTVNVPEDAQPGRYLGEVSVGLGEGYLKQIILVELVVHNITIPRHGRLKTCWIHRNEGSKPQYYGENWTPELQRAWFQQCIEYRLDADDFGSSAILPWNTVFTDGPDGKILADWSKWDAAYDYWYAQGRNTFLSLNAPDVRHEDPVPSEEDWRSQRFRLLEQHLVERGIYDNFYMYLFDEPQPKYAEAIKRICRWVHRQGSHLNLILTSCHDNERTYFDDIDIFVPHIDLFSPEFGEECRAAGKHYWCYTCIGTFATTYPDSWKIDYYGTGHRALGWWLFKYGSQGYLYWGLDYWKVNPWLDAETYPNGNGDGSLFYPAPDRKSLPYPALRAALVRDGFEDYELLWMLREKYGENPPAAVKRLLDAKNILIEVPNSNASGKLVQKINQRLKKHYYQQSDLQLIQSHRELLELLEK